MHFRLFAITLILFSTFAMANGRSPAVEDFVGIEMDHGEAAPQGHEALVNLEQEIGKIETVRKDQPLTSLPARTPDAIPWGPTAWIGIFFVLGLPIVSWMMVMNHLREKATRESASNIEVLEKYRKERELAKKQDEKIRKAS